MAASIIFTRSDENYEIEPTVIWIIEQWAWLSLNLRHVPDLLVSIQLLKMLSSAILLTENSRTSLAEKIGNIEMAFASHLLNCDDEEIDTLNSLPDTLERLKLSFARLTLLYSLGYEQRLRDEGIIPKDESPEQVRDNFSTLANQPISTDITGPVVCNLQAGQTFQTIVLGFSVTVHASGSDNSILVAESIVASVEAFFCNSARY